MNHTTAAAAAEATASSKAKSWPSPGNSALAAASSSPVPVIQSPCAACKNLRRRCDEKCMLAPYFPPNEPLKFAVAHRIFGASNIIKLLQEVGESERADAVNSMVYEANARLRDPIYGCAGIICILQNQIDELRVELARANAEILNMQCQNADLLHLLCTKNIATQENSTLFFDEETINGDSLWT